MKTPRDPREHKLPKWAQDLLGETRERIALRWPSEPEPEPDFSVTRAGHSDGEKVLWSAPDYADNREWFRIVGARSDPMVKSVFILHGYEYGDRVAAEKARGNPYGGGSHCKGAYYSTRREALLAAHWTACREAAKKLDRLIELIDGEPPQ